MIESISAVTLATHDMSRAVHFYRALGFEIVHGGEEAEFTSFRAGTSFLNLIARPRRKAGLGGRVVASPRVRLGVEVFELRYLHFPPGQAECDLFDRSL
jgi:catechol 2,3-dioxygenase-like lactoylglutathione lyase family enzyme